MSFSLEEALKIANRVVLAEAKRNLTDVEIIVFQGAWAREEYDQIAAKHQYATSYISQDVAPKLWRLLTAALGEKVKKSNFKEALKRRREMEMAIDAAPSSSQSDANRNLSNARTKKRGATSSKLHQQASTTPESDGESSVEATLYTAFLQPGALIRVKTSQLSDRVTDRVTDPLTDPLTNKTILINRVLARLADQHYQTAYLDLALASLASHVTDLNQFLCWLCRNLSRSLNLSESLEHYWDEAGVGAKVSCTTYLEQHVLAQSEYPLVVCLDNLDSLFPHTEIYQDFLELLRSWYEKARSRPVWNKLRLVILYETDVFVSLPMNQSPFSVGLPILL
jgi:hypothetical protein